MQKINNIILKTISAIFAVVLAAGCVFEKENPTATRDYKNVLVQLGIRTDGMIQTRADASLVGNEAATSAEKLVSSLRVYAYICDIYTHIHVHTVTLWPLHTHMYTHTQSLYGYPLSTDMSATGTWLPMRRP